jgi:enoyl-CoA hydratase
VDEKSLDHHLTVAADCVNILPPVIFQTTNVGAARVVSLNRADGMNALDAGCLAAFSKAIPEFARDTNAYAVVLQAPGPGPFCSGLAPRDLGRLAATDPAMARDLLKRMSNLIWLLECFSKPVIALIDGAVAESGAALTLVNTHRVAGQHYAFAVPEVHSGRSPGGGSAFCLSRLPDEIGTYLALTGRSIGRTDALALGLVTHCIDEPEFSAITRALAAAETVDPLLDNLHQPVAPDTITALGPLTAEAFAGASLADIIATLQTMQAKSNAARDWAAGVLADLTRASPSALVATLQLLRDARSIDLRQTLIIDHRLARNLIGQHDFQAAVRASETGPDAQSVWQPARASDVSSARIADMFKPDAAVDLQLPTRQEMQAARI